MAQPPMGAPLANTPPRRMNLPTQTGCTRFVLGFLPLDISTDPGPPSPCSSVASASLSPTGGPAGLRGDDEATGRKGLRAMYWARRSMPSRSPAARRTLRSTLKPLWRQERIWRTTAGSRRTSGRRCVSRCRCRPQGAQRPQTSTAPRENPCEFGSTNTYSRHRTRPEGLEPPTLGSEDRCSIH